jgi:cysteinyl-tRNA synthetase
MLNVLALDPVDQWPASDGGKLAPVVDALVAVAIEARTEARTRRDFSQADAIRDRLAGAGVVLEDTADGVRWRLRPEGVAQ